LNEARLTSDRSEGTHRAVHAAWNELLGFVEESRGPSRFHNGGEPYHAGRESVKKSASTDIAQIRAAGCQKTVVRDASLPVARGTSQTAQFQEVFSHVV